MQTYRIAPHCDPSLVAANCIKLRAAGFDSFASFDFLTLETEASRSAIARICGEYDWLLPDEPSSHVAQHNLDVALELASNAANETVRSLREAYASASSDEALTIILEQQLASVVATAQVLARLLGDDLATVCQSPAGQAALAAMEGGAE
jgi:hypothetical protein